MFGNHLFLIDFKLCFDTIFELMRSRGSELWPRIFLDDEILDDDFPRPCYYQSL